MSRARDTHWLGAAVARRAPPARVETRSHFVTMRDGTRIAIDVHLPAGAEPRPAILRMTRYLRSLAPRNALARALDVGRVFDVYATLRPAFLAAGYAWIDMDVRGTGASTGTWTTPWHEAQSRDAGEVIDWIVAQTWSNGRVGSLGVSYDGTAAEMLLTVRHPAVRAVAPLFSLYDVFADVAFPGGIHLAWFTEAWGRYNATLDRNRFHEAFAVPIRLVARVAANDPDPRGPDRLSAWLGRLDAGLFQRVTEAVLGAAIRGVRDVERPGDGEPSGAALDERRKNLDVHAGALRITHRDDVGIHPDEPERTIDSFSPHAHADAQRASGAAVYSYSGWRDGGYPGSAVKRWLALGRDTNPGSRLTLGPWAHTGRLAIHAFDKGAPTAFDHEAELVGFFDEHLRDAPGPHDGRSVHYFTTGEERWKGADAWPPPGFSPVSLALDAGGRLVPGEGARGADAHHVDPRAGTGERSRWRSLLSLVPGDYPDRAARDLRLLTWDTPPLATRLEVTGHVIAHLFASWDRGEDGHVFAYLEDVAPDGRVTYVTEGQLRALHRATTDAPPCPTPGVPRSFARAHAAPVKPGEVVDLAVDLLPCSHAFLPGHRVRLAVAGADADHFAAPPGGGATLRVHRGPGAPSRLVLPVDAAPAFR